MKRLPLLGFVILIAGAGLVYGWTRLKHEFGQIEAIAQPGMNSGFARNAPTHVVSQQMVESSEQMQNKEAFRFTAKGTDDKSYELAELLKKGPVLLTFNKIGCPCSVAAQPLFNQLAAGFPGVSVLGVVDGDSGPARLWLKRVNATYPQLLDPDLKIVRAFGVENSVYVALIDPTGKIVEHWPGISEPMLRELSTRLAKMTTTPEPKLDLRDAPADLYSGCPFNL